MVRVVETPFFIPYTKDSALKRMMQEVDDRIGEATNTPALKFVKRCGFHGQGQTPGPRSGTVAARSVYHAGGGRC